MDLKTKKGKKEKKMSNAVFATIVGVSTLVAFYWAMTDLAEEEEMAPEAAPEADPYEAAYPLDTGGLPETVPNMLAKRVEDETPSGRVVLRLAEGVFEYWADKPVAYKYLETVARKYVIVFDCRAEYVNMFRELLKAAEPEALAPEAAPELKAPSVFATFKKERKVSTARANRYHWMGRLAELDPPPARELPKEIRWADFKKKV